MLVVSCRVGVNPVIYYYYFARVVFLYDKSIALPIISSKHVIISERNWLFCHCGRMLLIK
uniref:Uncharacterized protein n=1 Tax=Anguilla anguilla TaxID=7936 RepID=A0A0E9UXD4_ANGAN